MGSKVISVSIKDIHAKFLDEHEQISPSEIVQMGIEAAIVHHKNEDLTRQKFLANIKGLQEEIALHTRYLEKIGKFEEWRVKRGDIIKELYDENKVGATWG